MDAAIQQLQRVLRLALDSPYEGERTKAVSLLMQRLVDADLSLSDLDPSFQGPSSENLLRERAGLAYDFEIVLKSSEEAVFYRSVIEGFAPQSVIGFDGHRLLCRAPRNIKQRSDDVFTRHASSLQNRLVLAQKQALREYQIRRQALFEEAIATELTQVQ